MFDLKPMIQELPELRERLKAVDEEAKAAIARVHELESEVQRAADEAEELLAERGSLLKIVEGLEGFEALAKRTSVSVSFNGTTVVDVVAANPSKIIRGREAVRRVLRERGRAMRQKDLIAEIKKREWIDPDSRDPDAAIRVATRRLVEDGEVEKVATGIYRYKLPSGTPVGDSAEAEGQSQLLAQERG